MKFVTFICFCFRFSDWIKDTGILMALDPYFVCTSFKTKRVKTKSFDDFLQVKYNFATVMGNFLQYPYETKQP